MSHFKDALALARLGFRIIPLHGVRDGLCCCPFGRQCRHPGKHPRCGRRWPSLATTNAKRIRAWINGAIDTNIGIATGGGLLVVDIDPDQGGLQSLRHLIERHRRFPNTATVRTGGGGLHYYFHVAADIRIGNTVGAIGGGIDTRGDGGLVVAPPSLHKSGNHYSWIRRPEEGVAEAPDWLVQLLADSPSEGSVSHTSTAHDIAEAPRLPTPPRRAQGDAREMPSYPCRSADPDEQSRLLADLVARFPITGPGMRNTTTLRAVASLYGRGYDLATATAVMQLWLGEFEGVYASDKEVAFAEASEMLERAFGQGRLSRSAADVSYRQAPLPAILAGFLAGGLLSLPSTASMQSTSLLPCGVGKEGKGRKEKEGKPWSPPTPRVTAFIDAILCHCRHKILDTDEDVIHMTDQQVKELMEERSGMRITEWDYAKLKARFITRRVARKDDAELRDAEWCELLLEIVKGDRKAGERAGRPSQYALSPLLSAVFAAEWQSAPEPTYPGWEDEVD